MKVRFQSKSYEVVLTDHAKIQMTLRSISSSDLKEVLETGEIKNKDVKNKFWVFKALKGRRDNLISISVSVESPRLIVITTLVNWSPK